MRKFNAPMLFGSDKFQNRWLYEALPDKAWERKPCFIIGGGPSLKNFDWSKLKGKRTIGINLAFMAIEPTIIFSMDTRFLNWLAKERYPKGTLERFLKARSYKVWLCTYTVRLPDYIFIVKVHRNYQAGLRAFTWSMKDGIGHGNNSGYAALNLACCLGADPIYLLGFDMKFKDSKTHWHQGHPSKPAEKTMQNFISYFEKAAPLIKSKGFRVINLNPDSGLNCFEKKKPEEVLH